MTKNRLMSGLLGLGLSLVAVPTVGVARTHYTGKVPASIVVDPLPTTARLTPHATRVRLHAARKVSHKKAAKHAAHRKHHKRSHKAKTAA